jgi:hypothetical protein
MMLSACTSAATADHWTQGPVLSPAAAIAPTSGPTSQPTVAPTSAPTPQPTVGPTSGSSAAPIGVPATGTAIYVSEWSVGLPTSMVAGQANFAITNIGTIQHELLVFKSALPPSAFPVDKDGNIIEDGPGITLVSDGDNIDPGKTQARTVDLTQPGTYLFVCNIPGHFKAGLFSDVTVTP